MRSNATRWGTLVVVVAALLAYHWFGTVGIVVVVGIGFPLVLAAIYYTDDLKARKPKDLGD